LLLIAGGKDALLRSVEGAEDQVVHRAGGNVKIALLLLHGCERREAETALDRAGGHLRVAMGLISKSCPDAPDLGELHHAGTGDSRKYSSD
jgi:N-acetylmuramic acid 6-phosphate (MurNAc-6-P) etherase